MTQAGQEIQKKIMHFYYPVPHLPNSRTAAARGPEKRTLGTLITILGRLP